MYLSLLTTILAVCEVSTINLVPDPVGIVLCVVKCRHVGLCVGTQYNNTHLRCVISTKDKDSDNGVENWPCGMQCDKASVCIHTRTKSSLCIRLGVVKRQARSNTTGRLASETSKPHYSINYRQQGSHGKGLPENVPKSKAQKALVISGTYNTSTTESTKRLLTPTGPPVEGLVSVSKVNRKTMQFHLMILSNRVWYPLYKVKGRVDVVKSRGNNVYWCQKKPTLCGRFSLIPETSDFTVLETKDISCRDMAVDEMDDTVIVSTFTDRLIVYSLRWVRKRAIRLDRRPSNLAVSPVNRLLYVTFPYKKKVAVFDYMGNRISSFMLNHVSRCIDIAPSGKILYSGDSNGTLTVVHTPYYSGRVQTDIHVGRLTSGIRLLAYNTILLIVTERSLRTYDTYGRRISTVDSYPMRSSHCHRTAPIVSFIGVGKPETKMKCISTRRNTTQKVLVGVKKFDRRGSVTNIYSFALPDGKWEMFRQIKGDLVCLVIKKSTLFHCQREPNGLFASQFHFKTWSKEYRIHREVCYSVDVDSRRKLVFFISRNGLKKHNFETHRQHGNMQSINGKIQGNAVSLDTVKMNMYLITLGVKNIRQYTYDFQLIRIFKTRETMRQLALYTSAKSYLYYTNRDDRGVLNSATVQGQTRGKILRINQSISGKHFSAFGVMSDKILLAYSRSVAVYCRSTLRELYTVNYTEHAAMSLKHMYVLEVF